MAAPTDAGEHLELIFPGEDGRLRLDATGLDPDDVGDAVVEAMSAGHAEDAQRQLEARVDRPVERG